MHLASVFISVCDSLRNQVKVENEEQRLCGRNRFGVGFEKKGGSGSLMGDISKCFRHCSRRCSDLQHKW